MFQSDRTSVPNRMYADGGHGIACGRERVDGVTVECLYWNRVEGMCVRFSFCAMFSSFETIFFSFASLRFSSLHEGHFRAIDSIRAVADAVHIPAGQPFDQYNEHRARRSEVRLGEERQKTGRSRPRHVSQNLRTRLSTLYFPPKLPPPHSTPPDSRRTLNGRVFLHLNDHCELSVVIRTIKVQ